MSKHRHTAARKLREKIKQIKLIEIGFVYALYTFAQKDKDGVLRPLPPDVERAAVTLYGWQVPGIRNIEYYGDVYEGRRQIVTVLDFVYPPLEDLEKARELYSQYFNECLAKGLVVNARSVDLKWEAYHDYVALQILDSDLKIRWVFTAIAKEAIDLIRYFPFSFVKESSPP